ncbi:MAG: universal stress protein [Sphingomonas sp.]
MIKTILAIVEAYGRAEGFIKSVLALAEHRQAHVIFDVLTAAPLISPGLAPFGTLYTLPGEIQRTAEGNAGAVRALLPDGAAAEVISHFDDVGWIPGDVRATAPLADVIVFPPKEAFEIGWLRRRTIETLLLRAGTPLLLLPSGGSIRSVNHAVLGWKPSAPSARAMHELIGIAAPGARIDVVTVKHGLGDQPEAVLDPVVTLLERHGFRVKAHALDRRVPTHAVLSAFALEQGADLLAVGGFAQSRVREIMLGGVTRSLIDEPRLPVLMAH